MKHFSGPKRQSKLVRGTVNLSLFIVKTSASALVGYLERFLLRDATPVHASTCQTPTCNSANCAKMKGLLKHGDGCKTKANGGCNLLCKCIWATLQFTLGSVSPIIVLYTRWIYSPRTPSRSLATKFFDNESVVNVV